MRPHRILAGSLFAIALVSLTPAPSADANPIPWKNCGKPTDLLAVQQEDGSPWPPVLTPVPLIGAATLDPVTGGLSTLRLRLVLGPDWIFDVGGVAGVAAVSGFVGLPEFISLVVQQPSLPLVAGPYSTLATLLSTISGAEPINVLSHANLGQDVESVTSSLSLSFEGMSGFPMPPVSGTYSARVGMTRSDERTVFCVDVELADLPIVSAVPLPFGGLRRPLRQRVDVGQPVPLEWWYTDAGGLPIKSPAAQPSVFFRRCGTDVSQDVAASSFRGRPARYNVLRRTWQFAWTTGSLPAGCYDVSIRSALTGQVDGPFPILLGP